MPFSFLRYQVSVTSSFLLYPLYLHIHSKIISFSRSVVDVYIPFIQELIYPGPFKDQKFFQNLYPFLYFIIHLLTLYPNNFPLSRSFLKVPSRQELFFQYSGPSPNCYRSFTVIGYDTHKECTREGLHHFVFIRQQRKHQRATLFQ